MSDLLSRLGYLQTRRDRTPNLDLARDLVSRDDFEGIREIARNLWNENKNIHSDCVQVMYEIARIDPDLVIPYVADFVRLLKHKNAHMVSGAITALAEAARVRPDITFKNLSEIKRVKESSEGTALDKSISALAHTSSGADEYEREIFPYLLSHLASCHFKLLPEHAERILPAVNENNQLQFVSALKKRMELLSGSDYTRIKKIIREAENI